MDKPTRRVRTLALTAGDPHAGTEDFDGQMRALKRPEGTDVASWPAPSRPAAPSAPARSLQDRSRSHDYATPPRTTAKISAMAFDLVFLEPASGIEPPYRALQARC
jgi:hypothetical protein